MKEEPLFPSPLIDTAAKVELLGAEVYVDSNDTLRVTGTFGSGRRVQYVGQDASIYQFRISSAQDPQGNDKPDLVAKIIEIVITEAIKVLIGAYQNRGAHGISLDLKQIGEQRFIAIDAKSKHVLTANVSNEFGDKVAVFANQTPLELLVGRSQKWINGPGELNLLIKNTNGKSYEFLRLSVNVEVSLWVDGKQIGGYRWSGWEPEGDERWGGPWTYGQ